MSENLQTNGQSVASVATPTQPAQPAQSAVNPPKTVAPTDEPSWLPERLERARATAQKETLALLGFGSAADVSAAVAARAAEVERAKIDAESLRQLRAKEAEFSASQNFVKNQAESEMAALTPTQRAAVEAVAGGDHGARLRAIAAMRPTWGGVTTPPATTVTTVAVPPGPPNSQPSKLAEWESLKLSNPMAASRFYLAHKATIENERKKQ